MKKKKTEHENTSLYCYLIECFDIRLFEKSIIGVTRTKVEAQVLCERFDKLGNKCSFHAFNKTALLRVPDAKKQARFLMKGTK